MKTARILTILVPALAVILFCPDVGKAAPLGTAFTYQGHLYDVNFVANGQYDFRFKLFDAATDGNQIGSDVNKPDVDVINGYFTVELDFGGGVFDGSARWLGIGIRPGDLNDPNLYIVMQPRQEVTPAPYALYAANVGSGGGGDGDWMVSGNDMYSIPTGDVGIGTTSPKNKLDIEGGMAVGATYSGANTAPSNGMIIQGNVGIGRTDPGYNLDVARDFRVGDVVSPGHYTTITDSGQIYARVWDAIFGYTAWGGYGVKGWAGGGSTVMSPPGIEEVTNIGVWGYGSTFYSLGWYHRGIGVYGVSGGDYPDEGWAGYFEGNVYASGNVGIGTTDPGSYQLYVNGTAYSTGGWQGSDLRFKESIKAIDSPVDKIKNIKGVSFKWKTSEYKDKGFPEGRHYGVIAQEVEEILPEIVREGPDSEKSVSYTELVPILTEAIKEQQEQIESLIQRIEVLESTEHQNRSAETREVQQ